MREILANYAHDAWTRWMRYVFQQGKHNKDGTVILPKWAVDRWRRQMESAYRNLSQAEQDSDRKEADLILKLVKSPFFAEKRELTEGERDFEKEVKNTYLIKLDALKRRHKSELEDEKQKVEDLREKLSMMKQKKQECPFSKECDGEACRKDFVDEEEVDIDLMMPDETEDLIIPEEDL